MKIRYINWRKEYPTAGPTCWKKRFSVQRLWSGKLIYIEVKHHCFQIDLRKDIFNDLTK